MKKYKLNIFQQKLPKVVYHPYYKNIYNNPPEGIEFVEDFYKSKEEYDNDHLEKNIAFVNQFKEACLKEGITEQQFNEFIEGANIESSLQMKPNTLIWVGVFAHYIGPYDWVLNTEDFWSFYYPHQGNGYNSDFDIKNSWITKILRILFEFDNCKQINTHIKDTVTGIKTLFGDKVFAKTRFLPHSVDINLEDIKTNPKTSKFTSFLFHGSSNHTSEHFFLRGGVETLVAFEKAYEKNNNIELNVVYNRNMLSPTLIERLSSHPGIKYYPSYLTDKELNQLRNNSDVLVLPSYHVHSISLLESMVRGNPVIGCDGWGFDEYLIDNYNGFIAKGQICSYKEGDGIFKENYSLGKGKLQNKLADNVEKAMLTIANSNEIYNNMRYNCIIEYYKNHNNTFKNEVLYNLIDSLNLNYE